MGKETSIVNECLMALSAAGILCWRQNTGRLPDRNGRMVSFGLCEGSADILAIAPGGIFVAVECKVPAGRNQQGKKTPEGKTTEAQDRFLAAVRARGGRAGIARTGAEAVAIARGPAGLPSG